MMALATSLAEHYEDADGAISAAAAAAVVYESIAALD